MSLIALYSLLTSSQVKNDKKKTGYFGPGSLKCETKPTQHSKREVLKKNVESDELSQRMKMVNRWFCSRKRTTRPIPEGRGNESTK